MSVLVSLLWLMSSIVFLTNPRNEKIRWACLIGFFGGCGGLGTLLSTSVERPEWILLLGGIFTSIGHYWTPYAILIFGFIYADIIKTRKKKRLCKLLCIVPTIIMYIPFYFPFQIYPEFKTNYVILFSMDGNKAWYKKAKNINCFNSSTNGFFCLDYRYYFRGIGDWWGMEL